MKIVLIGFMGSGKSSVAPILAAKLGLEAIEMDDLISAKAGGQTIEQIFEIGGETAFRQLEASVAKDHETSDNVVISSGGGVVMSQPTMDYLSIDAVVVELSASLDTILKRISPNIPRPLFKDINQAKELYKLRQPLYSKYATIHVATDNKSVEDVAEEVAKQVQNS
jgi:shikimate kinase